MLNKFCIIISCCLILSACDNGQSSKPQRKATAHLVESVSASYQTVSVSQTITGTLQAIRTIKIINQSEGLLNSLTAYPGDMVKAGDSLAQLDNTLINAEVTKAQAQLDQASLDFKRLQDLASRKLASESELALALTQKNIASSELLLKQTEYARSHITSPIDGVISQRLAEPGDVIPQYSHLLTLLDTTSLKAEIRLSELLLPLIKLGDPVEFSIDALSYNNQNNKLGQGKVYTGKINRIYPSIDQSTRKGTIEVILSPPPKGALAGQLCRVTIHTQSIRRLMLDFAAIRYDKLGSYVFTLNNQRVQRVNIVTGLQHNNLIEILAGINPQQDIISKGFFGLSEGMKVTKISSTVKPVQNTLNTLPDKTAGSPINNHKVKHD